MALSSAALEIGSMRRRLADVSVVTVTPFSAGAVDLLGVARNAGRLADAGVRVIVCGGNTGEFYALSPEELRSIVAATVEAVPEDVLIVASAGYRPELAVRLAAEGLEAGAKAIMLHYPPHPYIGEAGLGRYYESIASASPAPLILYARGAHFTESVARAASEAGDVVGVKYAVPDVAAFGRLAEALPDLVWTCGLAEGWAPLFWSAGARGFTSGLGNVAPELSLALLDALRAGDADESLRLWRLLLPFEQLRARHGDANNVAAVKAALDRLGLPGGPPRPPLSPLPHADAPELDRILSSWGLN